MENPIQVSFIRGFLDNKGANSEAATNPSFVPEVGTVEDQVSTYSWQILFVCCLLCGM